MASFKPGDKAKIRNAPIKTEFAGFTATILGPLKHDALSREGGTFAGYPIEIDGWGRYNRCGAQIHVRPEQLEPLTPPAEDTWAADKVRQVTKPQHMEPVAPTPVPVGDELPTLREVMQRYMSIQRPLDAESNRILRANLWKLYGN